MADDMVDRGAQGLGETVIADIGRHRLLHVDDVLVSDAIQLLGAHTGLDVILEHGQHFGRESAGNTHAFDVFGRFEGNGHEGACMAPQADGDQVRNLAACRIAGMPAIISEFC